MVVYGILKYTAFKDRCSPWKIVALEKLLEIPDINIHNELCYSITVSVDIASTA
jgi:hypothetical protein